MNERAFTTTAAERYDRALAKGLKLNPPPPHMAVPQPTCCWPSENIALLERYRDWLVGIGAADAVINQHRLPMAGHVLGLNNPKPHPQLHLVMDFDKALTFIQAKGMSAVWEDNCRHSLTWFRRFMQEERGLAVVDRVTAGDVSRYQVGLPDWLIEQLTRLLHLRQAGWRPMRMGLATYQFWYKSTRIWHWLFAQTEIQVPQEIGRDHIFGYIDEQLVAGYKMSSINHDLHTFQGTLRFLHEQGMAVPQGLLTLPGLRQPQSLPRFLADEQVLAVRDDLVQRAERTQTAAARRDGRLDLAIFYLLWQGGIRVSELEDLCLGDVDLAAEIVLVRAAKGVKDRSVYLTEQVVAAINGYLEVRGPSLTEHLFIYRHKPLAKDFVRGRLQAVGQRLGVKVTPHMLRHTFATQLVNAGAKITTIQALLGHRRLNTTLVYANVHDRTVAADFLRAMAGIEGVETAVCPQQPQPALSQATALLNRLEQTELNTQQQAIVATLRQEILALAL